MNIKVLQLFSGIVASIAVLSSAWLSHAGNSLPDAIQQNLYIAIIFAFIHVVAIFIVVVLFHQLQRRSLIISGYFFAFGILAFSGLIFCKAFIDIGLLAKLTPLGGMSFVFGWLILGSTFKGK